jgi:hypothetical protein
VQLLESVEVFGGVDIRFDLGVPLLNFKLGEFLKRTWRVLVLKLLKVTRLYKGLLYFEVALLLLDLALYLLLGGHDLNS